jgi:putative acetyltransferase
MRRTVASDIPQLSQIIDEVFKEYGWIYVEADEVPDFVKFQTYYGDESKARLYTIESTGDHHTIAGCIALKFNSEGPYLSRVYLSKEFRGIGLGKWMTNEVISIAREEGHPSIHLWTDTRFLDAHGMYKSLGFEQTTDLRSLHDINTSFEFKMVLKLAVSL